MIPVNMNQYDGLFGAERNYSAIPANMLNSGAADGQDFGHLVANGIKNAALNAMAGMVDQAYASGQLQYPASQQPQNQGGGMNLLIVGALLFVLFSGKKAS